MLNNASILIAEDENIIAKDISKTLERLGYDVLGSVRTGEDIIAEAERLQPDLVLMDIMLEGEMSGIEAAEKIMSSFDIPVIYLTALADNGTLQKAKITEPFGYVLKPFDERMLHSSIEMGLYKHQMNKKLKERTRELEEEKIKSNQLIHNILPAAIVRELRDTGFIKPREYSMITIMFTDFQGFTEISSRLHPNELVNELNDIFKRFDSIIDSHGLEKLKTMGDSYIVAGGLPKETGDHAVKVVSAALEMHKFLDERNISSPNKWQMRSGVHSGHVVAGVVGKNKFTYDVWGNTVNIASTLEKTGRPGMVNISSVTHELIKEHFECEPYGNLTVVGNGNLNMYFVRRKFNKQP